eukprot:TRINITY_DN11210_c0_g1_i1.p1 TRINITY_DN11210_c0_g1~~TRINITY_DN11210_c0_g1_i1.p1  ORF type:complete len:1551 (-),score=285.62 TRINITY_DN11210_c0_g1_i1:70-4206(-)
MDHLKQSFETNMKSPSEETKQELSNCISDTQRLFKDLCSLATDNEPEWFNSYLSSSPSNTNTSPATSAGGDIISKTFALDIIESILSNYYYTLNVQVPSINSLLTDKLCPALVEIFRTKKQFTVMLRVFRIFSVLTLHYPHVVIQQADSLITRVVVMLEGDSPLWLKTLALETLKNIVSQERLLLKLYETYDMDKSSSSKLFEKIVINLRRFVQIISEWDISGSNEVHTLDPKLKCLDMVSATVEPTDISYYYITVVTVHCLTGIVDGIQILHQRYGKKEIDEEEYKVCKIMAELSWPPILAALDQLLHKAKDEMVMQIILKAYQTFIQSCGDLSLATPRDAFLTSLKKYALPSSLSSSRSTFKMLANPPSIIRVSIRNIHTMKRIINISHAMGNTLGNAWDIVLDALEYLHVIINCPNLLVTRVDDSVSNTTNPQAIDDDFKEGREELYAISTSFSSLFATSHYLSDEALALLLEHLDKRTRATLFPVHGEDQEVLDQASESSIKIYAMFGLTTIIQIVEANMHRINTVWDMVNDFLNLVCNHGNQYIRVQGVLAINKIADSGLKQQENKQLQWSLLCTMKTLACSQYEDVRETTLDQIYHMLQSCGHCLSTGWPFILSIIKLTLVGGKFEPKAKHVSKAFSSLHYICNDFLVALTPECLKELILTLGAYGTPLEDVNISITSISGLTWTVSDFLAKGVNNTNSLTPQVLSDLWLTLFQEIRDVSLSQRHEIRVAAVRALFRIITTHGNNLKAQDWEATLALLFEMVDKIGQLASEASTEENLSEHKLGEEDGKSVMMLVHHSGNSAAKLWNSTRKIALEELLRVFKTYFATFTKVLSDVTACWQKLMSYVVLYWDSSNIEIALAGVKAVEMILEASAGVDNYPIDMWIKGWETYQMMVSTLTKKEENVSSVTINTFSTSISNLYKQLKPRFQNKQDIDLLVSIIMPLPCLPVSFAGELLPIRRVVMEIFEELSSFPEAVPRIVSILLNYISRAISYLYKPKCYLESTTDKESSTDVVMTTSDSDSWNLTSSQVNKFYTSLAERSIKAIKVIWSRNLPTHIRCSIFGDITHVLGKVIQLRHVCYESELWPIALSSFLVVVEEVNQIPYIGSNISPTDINAIWTDITLSIESYLIEQPSSLSSSTPSTSTKQRQPRSKDEIARDVQWDISMCEAITFLLYHLESVIIQLSSHQQSNNLELPTSSPIKPHNDSARIILLQQRLLNVLLEGTSQTNPQGNHCSKACYSLLFKLCAQPGSKMAMEATTTFKPSNEVSLSLAKLVSSSLIEKCRSVFAMFIKDEQRNGSFPMSKDRLEEMHNLLINLKTLDLAESVSFKKTGSKAHLIELFGDLSNLITTNDAPTRETLKTVFLELYMHELT